MTDLELRVELHFLDAKLQILIDELVEVRQKAQPGQKQMLSYVSKKVDLAAKSIGLALDKIEELGG